MRNTKTLSKFYDFHTKILKIMNYHMLPLHVILLNEKKINYTMASNDDISEL